MKNLITLSLLTIVLSSCGSGGSSSGGGGVVSNPNLANPSQAFYNTMSDGIYLPHSNLCINQNGENYKMIIGKALGEFSIIKQVYVDIFCTTELFSTAIVYTFVSATNLPDGQQATSISLIDAQLAVNEPQLLSDYNTQLIFGFNNWVLNTAHSVIDLPAQAGGEIIFKSNTVRSMTLNLVSPSVLILDGVQYNLQ